MSYRYPYGNTEQMNLDWFLNQWEKFKADWAEAEAGIDGSLDAEIAKVEAAMSELYAARDAAAASATAARQSSLDAAAAQVAAGNSKTAAQAAETSARGSQQAAAKSAQEAQASATGAENSALTATQAANTATQQAAGADAAKGAAEAAQQAAEAAQAAAAQSAGQAGQAATAAGDHADDAADSATLAQQAAQDMSDSVEQITTNKNDISDLKESISEDTGNLIETLASSVNVRGATVSFPKPGFINITGTATSSGGRTVPITKGVSIPAGTYTFQTAQILPSTLSIMVEIDISNTILAMLNSRTRSASFTVSDTTSIYVGINVINEATYNIQNLLLQVKSGNEGDIYPKTTAVDYIARTPYSVYDNIIPLSVKQLQVANPWTQGACIVDRKVVGFNASADDHSTLGTARIYDADNNLTQIGFVAHNTGHASTADYNDETNTMSIANGTYDTGVIPTIYLVKNASEKIASKTDILITDPDVVALDVSNLTGDGVGACFGETSQFMYVLTGISGETKYIHKLLMGKGTNDMTSLFASDNFGTFISGCGDNEYNGTAHLIGSYSIDVYGELQGMKYQNGYLYMSCDTTAINGTKTPFVAKIKLTEQYTAELNAYYHIPVYNGTGELIAAEAEGIVFDGNFGYVTAFPTNNTARAYRFNAII